MTFNLVVRRPGSGSRVLRLIPDNRPAGRRRAIAAAAVIALIHISPQSAFAQNRYWDSNNTTAGFGTAQGTWAVPTTGSATQNWSASSAGTNAFANYTTLITDIAHFGTDTASNGLGGGTITVSGTVSAASLRFGSQTTGNITLTGGTINLAATTSIHVGAGGTTVHTISSAITGAGTSLTKTGNVLFLSGTNTYAGQTIIPTGRLQFVNRASLYNANTANWTAANLDVNSGATLAFNVGGATEFTTGDITTLLTNLAASASATTGMNAGSNFGFDTTNAVGGSFTIADVIADSTGASGGARGVTKLGTNALVLGAANTYTGATTVSGGTLTLANASAVQNSSGMTLANGVTLQLATDTAFTTLPAISGSTGTTGTTIVSDRATAGAGLNHVLGTPSLGANTFNFTSGSNVTSGTAAITFDALNLASGSAGTAVLNPTTATLTITGGVTGTGAAVARTLNLGGTGTGHSIGGVISNGASNPTSLTKSDTSTWSLFGDSTYTGATTVNAGTLDLGGSTATGSLASPTLTLNGGTFAYTRTGSNTQGFTTTNINSSAAMISVAAGNTLNLGTVVRPIGAGFDFSTTGVGVVAALTANNVGGIMPAFTFGNTWAVANGAGVAISGLASGSYTLTSAAGTTAANYTNNNIDVDNSAGPLDGAITANSLRFSTAAANTVTLTGTPNVLTAGSILVSSGVGANLSTIAGGQLAGAASKDLAVVQNNLLGGLTISSVIADNTGATGLTKSGPGLLTLAGANTYTGVTAVASGTLQFSGAGRPGAVGSSVSVNSGALLDLNGTNQTITFVAGSGVGTVANNSGSGTSMLTLAGTATVNATHVTIVDNTTTPGGKVGVVITANTQPMNNANTYSGGTTVNGGAFLYLTSGTSLGAGTGPINLSVAGTGAAAQLGSGLVVDGVTYANDITGPGYVHNNSNAGATVVTTTFTGNLTTSGPFIFRGGTGIRFNFAGNGTFSVLSGVIGSTVSQVNGAVATGSIIKSGTGTLTLSGANVYTGSTTVSAGILNLSGPRTAASGAITVGNLLSTSATLNISNGTFTTGTFIVGQGDNPLTAGIVNQTGGTLTMSGNQLLLGNGGTGTAAGSNSTGTYNLSNGTLNTVAGALGVVIGVNTGATGVFNLSGAGILDMPATSTMQIARSDGNTATNTTGTFSQTGGTATVGILRMGGSGATTGAGGNATLSLTGGTFSAVTFNALSVGDNSTSAINISNTAQVTLPAFPTVRGSGATATITFDSGPTGFLSPAAASAAYMPAGTFNNAYLTANGAKFNVGAGKDITIGQVLANAVSPAASGTLTKSGAGVLTLDGANTYTGTTTITGGSLVVGVAGLGSLGDTAVTVGDGVNANTGVLGGSGVINNAGAKLVTISKGGTISPGNSAGTLTTGSQAWNAAGSYLFEIASPINAPTITDATGKGANWDLIQMGGGTLTVNATALEPFTIVNGGPAALTTDWHTIAEAGDIFFGSTAVNPAGGSGAVVDSSFIASAFTLPGDWNIQAIDIGTSGPGGLGNGYAIQVSAIPEPASIGVLALAGLGLLSRRRRMKASTNEHG